MSRPRLAPLIATMFALALPLGACGKAPRPADDSSAATERSKVPDPAPVVREPRGTVHVSTPGGERAVSVEVVRSEAAQARGLMYRQHLPPDDGMLFFMGEERVHSFWMMNTLIPLDIIFIGRDLKIVGIAENAEPRTTTGRHVGKPSLYVLEVNAGWSKAHGIGPGTAVRFEGVDSLGR